MSDSAQPLSMADTWPVAFKLSPLIRLTLLSLYLALTLPLPLLAHVTDAPVPPSALAIGIVGGWIALWGVLSERVIATDDTIGVAYPQWMRGLRRGWTLKWDEIDTLKARTTGQGGLVYYFVNRSGEAKMLPMRIVGFQKLLAIVHDKTGIDTTNVRALAQPWMYVLLLILTFLLLLVDGWTIWAGLTLA